MQQLYAEIKKSSKYSNQAQLSIELGFEYPFPVHIQFDEYGYHVKGGVGGQYRLADVDLYVIQEDKKVRIN